MKTILKLIFAVFGILIFFFGVACLLGGWYSARKSESFKPYVTYLKLTYLAAGCDDYKKQFDIWPVDINQLGRLRPDLNEAATDAYGNNIHLSPYSDSLGYGELTSYGRDGKPGGSNFFDTDIVIRFPPETETNAQWNKQVGGRFKAR